MNADSALTGDLRHLRDAALFKALDGAVFTDIIGKLRPEHWSRHRVVMSPTDTLKRFYVLRTGRIKVINQNPETGRELTLFLLGPGDGFNVISLLDGLRHEVTVVTLDVVDALSAPLEQWWAWMETYPALHHAMHRYVDKRLQQLSELASDLALYDTMTRLVHLILRHFASNGEDQRPRRNLIQDLPHDELAHMIGSVRVVVNRLLSELRQEGIVDTAYGELRVLDLEKLVQKAEQHMHRNNLRPHGVTL